MEGSFRIMTQFGNLLNVYNCLIAWLANVSEPLASPITTSLSTCLSKCGRIHFFPLMMIGNSFNARFLFVRCSMLTEAISQQAFCNPTVTSHVTLCMKIGKFSYQFLRSSCSFSWSLNFLRTYPFLVRIPSKSSPAFASLIHF